MAGLISSNIKISNTGIIISNAITSEYSDNTYPLTFESNKSETLLLAQGHPSCIFSAKMDNFFPPPPDKSTSTTINMERLLANYTKVSVTGSTSSILLSFKDGRIIKMQCTIKTHRLFFESQSMSWGENLWSDLLTFSATLKNSCKEAVWIGSIVLREGALILSLGTFSLIKKINSAELGLSQILISLGLLPPPSLGLMAT